MNEKQLGLGTAVPANVTSDLTYLSSVAAYVNTLQSVTSLTDDVSKLTPIIDSGSTLVAETYLSNITGAYNAVFGNASIGGDPVNIALNTYNAIKDVSEYINETNTALTNANATIASLQQQLAAKSASPVTVATPQQANAMSTATFAVGVAAVLAIGGGVWWMSRNARTKAKEFYGAKRASEKQLKEAE